MAELPRGRPAVADFIAAGRDGLIVRGNCGWKCAFLEKKTDPDCGMVDVAVTLQALQSSGKLQSMLPRAWVLCLATIAVYFRILQSVLLPRALWQHGLENDRRTVH